MFENQTTNSQPTQSQNKFKKFTPRLNATTALWVVVILLAAGLGYMIWQNQELQKPEAQSKLVEQANQELVEKVGKIFLLPAGEEPTIANIVDIESLKKNNEDFYKDAQNGDYLLIYTAKAVIYREPENKVINVAPVVVSPDQTKGVSTDDKKTEDKK